MKYSKCRLCILEEMMTIMKCWYFIWGFQTQTFTGHDVPRRDDETSKCGDEPWNLNSNDYLKPKSQSPDKNVY